MESGAFLRDRWSSAGLPKCLDLEPTECAMGRNRLRCFGHATRKEADEWVSVEMESSGGQLLGVDRRKRGTRWSGLICFTLGLLRRMHWTGSDGGEPWGGSPYTYKLDIGLQQ